jgi:hypothetical protein
MQETIVAPNFTRRYRFVGLKNKDWDLLALFLFLCYDVQTLVLMI